MDSKGREVEPVILMPSTPKKPAAIVPATSAFLAAYCFFGSGNMLEHQICKNKLAPLAHRLLLLWTAGRVGRSETMSI